MMNIQWEQEVEKRKEQLLNDLFGLLKIASVKDLSTATAERPMGNLIGEALDYMLKLSTDAGFKTENIEGYAGYAELGESEDYIGVLGHIDVVPASGKWTTPPFEPVIRDGKIYARGAIDDKGPTMAAFYAMKILKELGLPIKNRIRLIVGTDEESGMRCMKKYFEVEKMPKFGFSPDADFPLIHAEKGQINVKISIEGKPSTGTAILESFTAGDRINMVPGAATATVQTNESDVRAKFEQYLKDENLKGTSQSGDGKIELSLEGKSVHGMEPQNGINAGLKLLKFLSTLPFEGQDQQYILFGTKVLDQDFYGNKLGVGVSDDILGPLTVNAGVLSYTQDEGGAFQLNIRCPIAADYGKVKSQLSETASKHGLTVEVIGEKGTHHVSKDHPMIQALQKVYQERTGDEPTLLTTGGATYARFMESGVAFGACFPGKEMTAHQADEYFEVDDLLKATAIYAQALYELANL